MSLPWLRVDASVLYYRLHYLPLIGVLLWVLLRHRDAYPRLRTTVIAMATLALLVFWLVPMSPPRFALAGIVDFVADNDLFGSTASRDMTSGQNHFSAMPSLHVGWSALCAYSAWLALKDAHPRLALLPWLFPTFMVCVVIATGNHYLLDVVGSVVLLAASIGAAVAIERLRPDSGGGSLPLPYAAGLGPRARPVGVGLPALKQWRPLAPGHGHWLRSSSPCW